MPDEPSYQELQAYLLGHTQIEASERFGISRSRVQRIIKAGEDQRGPAERAVDEMIAEWGELDKRERVRAELFRSAAVIVDRGRTTSTGAFATAAVQAFEKLTRALDEMGQSKGVEDLRAFLLREE